ASAGEAFERGLDVMQLGGLQKGAARAISAIEVEHSDDTFSMHFVTPVPQFKVTEKYTFGREVAIGRRDLRSGRQMVTAEDAGDMLVFRHGWGDPVAGSMVEEFTCPEDGVLHMLSVVEVAGKAATVLQVYRRQ
ncbi:unnamed protein product, partial [Ostreobium quekettii]